jgi:hypothetical protein
LLSRITAREGSVLCGPSGNCSRGLRRDAGSLVQIICSGSFSVNAWHKYTSRVSKSQLRSTAGVFLQNSFCRNLIAGISPPGISPPGISPPGISPPGSFYKNLSSGILLRVSFFGYLSSGIFLAADLSPSYKVPDPELQIRSAFLTDLICNSA